MSNLPTMTLKRSPDQKVLIPQLREAKSFVDRLRGLLGTSSLSADRALWFQECNSIHTFFMKYPIDCVFLDQNFRVVKIAADVKPGRITWPIWKAKSVIEMQSGLAAKLEIKEGDQVHVGA